MSHRRGKARFRAWPTSWASPMAAKAWAWASQGPSRLECTRWGVMGIPPFWDASQRKRGSKFQAASRCTKSDPPGPAPGTRRGETHPRWGRAGTGRGTRLPVAEERGPPQEYVGAIIPNAWVVVEPHLAGPSKTVWPKARIRVSWASLSQKGSTERVTGAASVGALSTPRGWGIVPPHGVG